ncbi:MAG: Transcriptional regulator, ArsR family [Candidatus Saccharibacteria bacterium]|nr:Transcriptional regulator, ArsR family [Candidatus Saccharibacteria bacterium]
MVERTLEFDNIFNSLADSTRRDILRRVAATELSISEIAKPYKLTFGAISKHLLVLERANLVVKRRQGKEQIVSIAPDTIESVSAMLQEYQKLWETRFGRLDALLEKQTK